MTAIENTMEQLKVQIGNIDSDIEIKSNEIRELKKVRRKLQSTVDALGKL
jgi:archaellum component FlaC